jgi:hypothetical protein
MGVWDKFSKHGLPGLVIAALFYLVVTFHQDSVITVREITVSTYQLRNAVEKQTVVLDQLSQIMREPKYDTVLNPTLGSNSVDLSRPADHQRDSPLVDEVQGGLSRAGVHFWVAKEDQKIDN